MDSNYGTHVSGKSPIMVPVLIMDWLLNIDEPWSQGRILCMGRMIIRLDVSWFFSMVGQWGENQFLKPWLHIHIPVFIPVNGVTNQLVNALNALTSS